MSSVEEIEVEWRTYAPSYVYAKQPFPRLEVRQLLEDGATTLMFSEAFESAYWFAPVRKRQALAYALELVRGRLPNGQ